MKWTLDQLRTFVAVAELGSMTAAAGRLGYTTGAVSQQMQALAAAVGRPLLVRAGRGVELTDHGRALVRHARAVLDAERLAERALSGPTTALDLQVDLGVFGSAAVVAIPQATRRLAAVAPHIALRAREVDVERMPEAVADGAIDLALGLEYPATPVPPPRGVRRVPLRREEFLVVVTPELEPLRQLPELVRVANETGWIVPPAESGYGRAVRLALDAAGVEPRIAHLVTDTAVSFAMAASGLGSTLATPLMLRLHPGRAITAPLPGGSARDVVAFVREGSLERESVATVLEVLREVLAPGAPPPAQ
ncbi:MAG: LysR family transcriptional regulator [Microbacteriaceae bacterium]|nr:LysR family transcriptional regulator [Microbacteriaceae bacterium]